MLLSGCVFGSTGLSAQTTDSVTSACLRTAACYTQTPGEEAILPWLSRTVEAARTTHAVMRLLDAAQLARIEELLVQCARRASDEVERADEVLRGRSPDAEECRRVVRRENGRDVTRAMDLGNKKHAAALPCIREELVKRFPDHVSLEPRYQRDPDTGSWIRLDPVQVAEWVQLGLTGRLWGSLAPDIVIHESGNPNKLQRVYDLKFPCPEDNQPRWGRYSPEQPHFPKNQGRAYRDALLGGQHHAHLISPRGVY
ncbi:hypothetical protein [Melittangium boletus]|uniref:Uncharacterized protein n=1 Tax=Melittangium boletus DSM 14713 TaxID=1294270 RepID=A0A250ICW6_9BACT|nr:hypothetical protein [Melittangium boletus]ATB28786.1 hypothetical protein MEBOL_002235 [Melittangium boletus DSM 14713]